VEEMTEEATETTAEVETKVYISPEKKKRLSKTNGLKMYQEHVAEAYGLDRSKYVFRLIEVDAQPRYSSHSRVDAKTKKTLCIYKDEQGTLRHTEATLNPFEDKFFGPIGEKAALQRLVALVRAGTKLAQVTIAEAETYVPQ